MRTIGAAASRLFTSLSVQPLVLNRRASSQLKIPISLERFYRPDCYHRTFADTTKLRTRMTEKLENYARVSSEAYGIWFPEKEEDYEDAAFYRGHILNNGQPALEVGCGDGRLLIPFLKEGLNVEGLDLSPHMLDNCRKKAASKNVAVTLYQQAMQSMDLPKKYSTIYIPYGSFMLVHRRNEVEEALSRFHRHLNPAGKLLVSLFDPTVKDVHVDAPAQGTWRLRREGTRHDGALFRCYEKASFDTSEQLEESEYRYEVLKDGKTIETEEEKLTLRWHTQSQFRDLLRAAGFNDISCVQGYTAIPAESNEEEFTFIATR